MKFAPSQWRWLSCAAFCILLATIAAVLIDLLLIQWRPSFDLGFFHHEGALSERSLSTLADTAGTISVASILPEDSPATAPVGRLLRRFEKASAENSGAHLDISYIDPRTNPRLASQMAAQGAPSIGILFRQAGRHVFIPEHALLDANNVFDPATAEEAIAAAFLRLSRTDGIQVGWITGHGEPDFESADPLTGYSGFRRALENEGYVLKNLTLTTPERTAIPAELNVIILTAPRYPLTLAEYTALSDWLDHGGRLFCILPANTTPGLDTLLESWGIRVGTTPRTGLTTTADGSSLTTLFDATHPITAELAGKTTVTVNAPKAIYPFAVRGIEDTHLVQLNVAPLDNAPKTSQAECATILLAAERGSLVGTDLGFRPGRIVVAGDETFINNHYVLNHASANRDLAINTIRWLTGLTGSGARGASHVLIIGHDRQSWIRLFLISGICFPLLFCLFVKLLTWKI